MCFRAGETIFRRANGSVSVSVVLLDTTGEEKLEWTRYPYGPQASTPGVSVQQFFAH